MISREPWLPCSDNQHGSLRPAAKDTMATPISPRATRGSHVVDFPDMLAPIAAKLLVEMALTSSELSSGGPGISVILSTAFPFENWLRGSTYPNTLVRPNCTANRTACAMTFPCCSGTPPTIRGTTGEISLDGLLGFSSVGSGGVSISGLPMVSADVSLWQCNGSKRTRHPSDPRDRSDTEECAR